MAYSKIDVVEALQTAETLVKAGHAPCTACRGLLVSYCLDSAVATLNAEKRRANHVRRVRRTGNLIEFPKR